MSLDKESRHDAIKKLSEEGLPEAAILSLLRYGSRLHQLAEAECNGDYPADNGQRIINTCPFCESGYAPESFRAIPLAEVPEERRAKPASIGQEVNPPGKYLICPSCYTERQVKALIAKYPGFGVSFGGDPRGAVLIVTTPNGRYNDWGQRGIVVG